MHFVIVSFLDEFHLFTIESIKFNAINVGPIVVKTNLFNNGHSVAEADATIIAISVGTFILVADEHLLTIIPCRDMYSWAAEGWQNIVEQVLTDCFCQCCNVFRFWGLVV